MAQKLAHVWVVTVFLIAICVPDFPLAADDRYVQEGTAVANSYYSGDGSAAAGVLASNIFNNLRHFCSPSAQFLKRPLKFSRSGLVPFHLISGVLRPRS